MGIKRVHSICWGPTFLDPHFQTEQISPDLHSIQDWFKVYALVLGGELVSSGGFSPDDVPFLLGLLELAWINMICDPDIVRVANRLVSSCDLIGNFCGIMTPTSKEGYISNVELEFEPANPNETMQCNDSILCDGTAMSKRSA